MKKIVLAGLLIPVLVVYGCTNTVATGQVVGDTATIISSGNVKEFNVKAFRFGFEPSTIRVNQGDTVRIIARSIDVPHGLTIDGYNINLYLDGLRPQTVEFVADKPGTFTMYCSVPCGSGHGSMRGKFIVE